MSSGIDCADGLVERARDDAAGDDEDGAYRDLAASRARRACSRAATMNVSWDTLITVSRAPWLVVRARGLCPQRNDSRPHYETTVPAR